jgi:prepilin-type N-terminal cleavage/methylation domain-containing protein
MLKKYIKQSQGFSLVEIIIVVGVLAILAGLSFPTLLQFLKQRDVTTERAAQLQISQAFQAYIAQNGNLPADSGSWATELAPFTNLSPNQLLKDTWSNDRRYIMFQRNETLLGQSVPVFYVSVHSRGPDLRASAVANSIPVNGNDYQAATDSGWWKAQADPTAAYASLAPAGDDLMVKFTDYTDKIEKYNLTLKRLQDIGAALESYSRTKFAEALSAGVLGAENFIYYPPAQCPLTGSCTVDNWAEYGSNVKTDVATIQGGSQVLNMSDTNSTRRTAMINLMRVLGLPDTHCCSAIETFNNGGTIQEIPLFYASNPRPRVASGCGTRPNPIIGNTALSPRISTRTYGDASSCY